MKTVLKAKSDPVWFCNNVLEQPLFPQQERALRLFYQNRYDPRLEQMKRLIMVWGMRSGKTALASMIGAYEFFDVITLDNPSKYYNLLKNQPIFLTTVATSSTLAEDGVFYNWINYIESSEWFNTWADVRIRDDRITCDEKNVICQVLGSWATTVAGRSNRFVAFDELDLFEQATQGKRSGWEMYATLSKSTATFGLDGHIMAISSPKTSTGVIMSLYRRGLKEPNTVSILLPTWEANPNYTKEALMEEHKYDLATFWRDFGCQPEIAGGVQFPERVKLTKMTNVLKTPVLPPDNKYISRVMSIDPAVTSDSFGIATAYVNGENNIVVDGVHKFTKTEGAVYISPREVESFIYAQVPRLHVNAFVYDVWMFPNIIEEMHLRFGIEAEKHIVSKEDYDRWRGLQNNTLDTGRQLSVVYDEELETEVNNLIVKSLDSGKAKTDHPANFSKDMADCVANCIWYLTEREEEEVPPNVVYIKAW